MIIHCKYHRQSFILFLFLNQKYLIIQIMLSSMDIWTAHIKWNLNAITLAVSIVALVANEFLPRNTKV